MHNPQKMLREALAFGLDRKKKSRYHIVPSSGIGAGCIVHLKEI
jgi:hypothetical protein